MKENETSKKRQKVSQEVKQARSEAEADWADRVTDSKEWVKKSLLI